ncbi:MAG: universal stress protein [Candidatus Bathyarchaeia archaeon]
MFKKILVPVDGSEDSRKALKLALDIASRYSSKLTALYVVAKRVYAHIHELGVLAMLSNELEKEGKEVLKEAQELAKPLGLEIETKLVHGFPAEEILNMVEKESYDLVVIGSRGLSGVKAFFLGSVSDKVTHHARCSVLIVK